MSNFAHNKNIWAKIPILVTLSRYDQLQDIARYLGIDRTTVVRQLARLEEDVGAKLFERSQGKVTLTSIGADFVKCAETFEVNLNQLTPVKETGDNKISGPIRISIAPHICQVIAPMLNEMALKFADADFEILSSYDFERLGYKETDLAIRLAKIKPAPPLKSILLMKLRGAIYRGRNCKENGRGKIGVIRKDEVPIPNDTIFQREATQIISTNDILVKQELLAAGSIGRLPCWIGDNDPRLERVSPLLPDAKWKLWLTSHGAYSNSVKIGVISEFIVRYFQNQPAGKLPR